MFVVVGEWVGGLRRDLGIVLYCVGIVLFVLGIVLFGEVRMEGWRCQMRGTGVGRERWLDGWLGDGNGCE